MSNGEIFGSLRPMHEADIVLVLNWRNHPEVRRFMYTQHEISEIEHRRWFAQASTDERRWLMVYEENDCPVGYANIFKGSASSVADWGFYIGPGAAPGVGTRLGRAVLRFSFGDLNLHKLCGEVLGHNEKSMRFHERLGFVKEGVLREQHFDGTAYNDVVRYGLLKTEWTSNLLESHYNV